MKGAHVLSRLMDKHSCELNLTSLETSLVAKMSTVGGDACVPSRLSEGLICNGEGSSFEHQQKA